MYQETPPHVATEWQHLYAEALSEPDHEKRERLSRSDKRNEQSVIDTMPQAATSVTTRFAKWRQQFGIY